MILITLQVDCMRKIFISMCIYILKLVISYFSGSLVLFAISKILANIKKIHLCTTIITINNHVQCYIYSASIKCNIYSQS